MRKLQTYSEGFKLYLEKFIIGCDSMEETEMWDKATYGEMEAYYQNNILCLIVKLISADGVFSPKEVEFVNEVFGFEYTTQELKEIYHDFENSINAALDVEIRRDLDLLRAINLNLAKAYETLLITVCDIIIECDGYIDKAESKTARVLRDKLVIENNT